MPNRIIKESICSSESLNELSWFEEVVFYRLIVNCDDYGCFDARTPILKARLFPLKSVTEKQITDALHKLATAGIVRLYEYEQKPYLQFSSWAQHQQMRAQKHKFPEPDITCNQMISDDIRCSSRARNPIQSESNPNPNPNPKLYSSLFLEFWKVYPRKADKISANKAWTARIKDGVSAEEIIKGAEAYAVKVAGTEEKYIKMPATFLNAGSYENDPMTAEERAIQEWVAKEHEEPDPPKVVSPSPEYLECVRLMKEQKERERGVPVGKG